MNTKELQEMKKQADENFLQLIDEAMGGEGRTVEEIEAEGEKLSLTQRLLGAMETRTKKEQKKDMREGTPL